MAADYQLAKGKRAWQENGIPMCSAFRDGHCMCESIAHKEHDTLTVSHDDRFDGNNQPADQGLGYKIHASDHTRPQLSDSVRDLDLDLEDVMALRGRGRDSRHHARESLGA